MELRRLRLLLELSRRGTLAAVADTLAYSPSSISVQLAELERIGCDAVLIGEALMRSGDPEAAVRELTTDEEHVREHYAEGPSDS